MKIIENEAWPEKVNFVDENNVVVGFDSGQQCCESFGWTITPPTKHPPRAMLDTPSDESDLDGFVFDPDAFDEFSDSGRFDEGGAVAFTMRRGDDTRYLILHNSHNGYYSHGFTVEVGGEVVRKGGL